MNKLTTWFDASPLRSHWLFKLLITGLLGLIVLILTHYPVTSIGFVGGLTIGLTGIGAGSVINTLLLLFFPQLSLPLVVGTSAVQGTLLKLLITAKHYAAPCLYRDQVFWMVLGAVPTTIVGSTVLVQWMEGTNLFRLALYSVLILVSVVIFMEAWFFRPEEYRDEPEQANGWQKLRLVFIGALLGLIVGATSTGTGTLMVSTLLLCMRFPVKKAISLALWSGGIILFVAAISHIIQGHVDWTLFGHLIYGSLAGVILGRLFCQFISSKLLRMGVAVLIFYLMVENILKLSH